jgi:hypothetical protein
MNRIVRSLILLVAVVTVGAPSLLAQKWEVHPYAGGFWPSGTNIGQLKSEGIYGVRGGFFLEPSTQLEGNFGYINHFKIKGTDPAKARGLLFDVNVDYNFGPRDWPLPEKFTPHITAGVGGLKMKLDAPFVHNTFSNLQLVDGTSLDVVRPVVMEDGDTFLTFNFGGGVKSNRLWGPLGLRGDVRGRFLPNFYGSSPIWLEATGGINFTWGGN